MRVVDNLAARVIEHAKHGRNVPAGPSHSPFRAGSAVMTGDDWRRGGAIARVYALAAFDITHMTDGCESVLTPWPGWLWPSRPNDAPLHR